MSTEEGKAEAQSASSTPEQEEAGKDLENSSSKRTAGKASLGREAVPPRRVPGRSQPWRSQPSSPSNPPGLEAMNIPKTALKEKYEFLTVLGAGGAGVIYKARQQPLGRLVAVKMVHSHLMSPTAVRRFHQEAKTISNLSHPNIISVYDFGISEENQPFMVMDYVEGIVLSDMLRNAGRLPDSVVKSIAVQLCEGLGHAHMRGILHRDLKPSNIMMVQMDTGQMLVKILDFGLAKIIFEEDEEGEQQHLTKTGETVGTPAFMSPEQVMSKKVDHRSDLYSLGCVLYQCLTGEPPFVGETKMETMLMHLDSMPEPINIPHFNPIVTPYFEAIVMKLLEKNPLDRFQSMWDLKDAIEGGDTSFLNSKSSSISVRRAASIERELHSYTDTEAQLAEDEAGEEEEGAEEPEENSQTQVTPDSVSTESVLIPQGSYKMVLIAVSSIFLLGVISWVLYASLFNNQAVKMGSNEAKTKKSGSKLRDGSEPFDVLGFSDDEFRGQIRRSINEDHISSRNEPITDKALIHLSDMRNLKWLELKNDANVTYPSTITPKGFQSINGHLKLEYIDLSGTRMTDDISDVLTTLPALQYVNLSRDYSLTDDVLNGISRITYLKSLKLDSDKISDAQIGALANLKYLSELSLSGTQITDKALETIGKMTSLTKLDLSNTKVTDNGVAKLVELRNLNDLNLSNTAITDKVADMFVNMNKLELIQLSHTQFGDKGIRTLRKAKWLSHLWLQETRVTRSGLVDFQRAMDGYSCTIDME